MSRPQPGIYVIYNRVLNPSGDKLAITFNGLGATVTVTPLSTDGPQKWVIADAADGASQITQSVTPTTDSFLQAAYGANVVTTLISGHYFWAIRSSDTGYTIKDGGATVNWGVAIASSGEDVTIGGDTGDEKQRWIFERV